MMALVHLLLVVIVHLHLVASSPLELGASMPRRVTREASSGDMVLVDARRSGNNRVTNKRDTDVSVPAGEAVDIFYRYGFFSLSVRVVPRDDAGSWIIREPTSNVFLPGSTRTSRTVVSNTFNQQFQIFFCDDVQDLMKHYFNDFTAEGVGEPYRLYTGSWRDPTVVKYFGLSESTLHSNAGFVLVKLLKNRVRVDTKGDPVLKPEAAAALDRITVNDEKSVKDFVQNYGSHYIKSLTIGDAVYQILALDRPSYTRAKEDVLINKKVKDFTEIYDQYLAPWLVQENGKVQAASGDKRVMTFLKERVVKKLRFNNYPSIFEIKKNDELLEQLEVLTANTEAIIAMAFRSIGSLLTKLQEQIFYNEVINTQLALWEVNI